MRITHRPRRGTTKCSLTPRLPAYPPGRASSAHRTGAAWAGAAAALLISMLPGCVAGNASERALGPRGGQVITQEQIQQTSAADGWEVLSILGRHLEVREFRDGPVRSGTVNTRGRTSIHLSTDPLLVVDGIEKTDLNALRDIPASDIETMRIVSAVEASTFYGTMAGGGLVEVRTRNTGGDVDPVRPDPGQAHVTHLQP